MIVPSTRLFQAGEVETGAYLNSAVTNMGNFLLGKPIAQLRQTVAQNLTSGSTYTALTFDTEDVDRDNGHSTSTNTSRYTAQTAGWYYLAGGGSFAANATNQRGLAWQVNGTQLNHALTLTRYALTASQMTLQAPSVMQYLNVGDYVELGALNNSGVTLATVVTQGYQPYMTVIWVSA